MLITVFIIPGFFYSSIFKEEKDLGNVSTENRRLFNEMIDSDIIGKKIPGILGQGEEFVKMKVRNQQELDLMKQIRASPFVGETMPQSIEGRTIQIKPICLLVAYMCGMIKPDPHSKQESLGTDLECILRTIPSYLDIIIEECIKLIAEFKQRQTHKRLTCQNILGILQFSQNLMQ